MKKNWSDPELKNLSLGNTNEEGEPFFFQPDAGRPCLCKKEGASTYGKKCKPLYHLLPCEYFTPITAGCTEWGNCQYIEQQQPIS